MQRSTCLMTAQDNPWMHVPLLIKPASYPSVVVYLFLWCLLALCVWEPACAPRSHNSVSLNECNSSAWFHKILGIFKCNNTFKHIGFVPSSLLFQVVKLCLTFCDPVDYSLPGSSVHGISWKDCWSGLPFPSQGIFPTQGWNLFLLHWQADSSLLSHQGSPFVSFLMDFSYGVMLSLFNIYD